MKLTAIALAALLTQAGQAVAAPIVVSDPVGDNTLGQLAFRYDITSLEYGFDHADFQIGLLFAGPIIPFDIGNPESLFGIIEIDADNNPATGPGGVFTALRGVEFRIALDTDLLGPDKVPISSSAGGGDREGRIAYGPNSLEVRFDSGIVAGYANPVVAATIGTLIEPNDTVPNSTVPEPSAAATLFAGTAVLFLYRLRKRRRQA